MHTGNTMRSNWMARRWPLSWSTRLHRQQAHSGRCLRASSAPQQQSAAWGSVCSIAVTCCASCPYSAQCCPLKFVTAAHGLADVVMFLLQCEQTQPGATTASKPGSPQVSPHAFECFTVCTPATAMCAAGLELLSLERMTQLLPGHYQKTSEASHTRATSATLLM